MLDDEKVYTRDDINENYSIPNEYVNSDDITDIDNLDEYQNDERKVINELFNEDESFNIDNPRASERMNEIEKYLSDYGVESPSDVINHLLDSGYSDKQISEIVDNDYIGNYDIMENVRDYSDLGERALMGESPQTMLGDRVSYYIDEKRLEDDLYDDLREIYYDNNPDIEYDDLGTNEDFINWKDDYIQEILDNPEEYLGDKIEDYFDYDKFGYDLSLSDYYFDEDSGIASRNN